MARANPYRPFSPDPEQTARTPPVSGNAVNGLGETEPRRPRMVYWAPDPDDIPHGDLQRYFYSQSTRVAAFADRRAARQAVLDAPLPPVAGRRAARPPQDWTAALANFVNGGTCEMTGVARMRPDWVYEGREIAQSTVIMIGVAHDYDAIATAPEPHAGLEVMTQYTRAAAAAK